MPVRKLAAELDIDPSLLSKLERGERQPSSEFIKKVAAFFMVDESELLKEHLSDKIAYQIKDFPDEKSVLKLAEEKVKYYRISKK